MISLMDLSHSLRMWADLKLVLPRLNPKFSSNLGFKSGAPSRRMIKEVSGSNYVLSYLPGGAITLAANGELCAGPGHDQSFFAGVRTKRLGGGSQELSQFYYVEKTELDQNLFNKGTSNEKVAVTNFTGWMNGEVARYCLTDDKGETVSVRLTREVVIRRVANSKDGSHPSIAKREEDDNSYDKHIDHLMKYRFGGLPLPYFILIHAGQTILGKYDLNEPS